MKAARSPVRPARRAEGFPGQRLVVLPASVRARNAAHPLLRGLHVTDAGYFPVARGHFMSRPAGADAGILIACVSGEGWVDLPAGLAPVRAGQLVWIPPGCAHGYGAGDDNPWSIEWVHFDGEELSHWQRRLAGDGAPAVLEIGAERLATLALGAVYSCLEHGYSEPDQVLAASTLRLALAETARFRVFAGVGHPARERVAATIPWMQKNLRRNLRLREMAAAAKVSVPHYCALFRRQTGYPPVDYFMRMKIQQACTLLATSQAKVQQVALEIGYEDAAYFSRLFKRIMGESPREYRGRYHGAAPTS